MTTAAARRPKKITRRRRRAPPVELPRIDARAALQTKQLVEAARAPRLRSMRDFAEAEIFLPEGPFKGRRFRVDRQPYTGLWFDQIDSGRYRRFVATGPSQSGKSLIGYVIPGLYHLFERRETIILGVPDFEMFRDKWREDILPVIEASPMLRRYLPRSGSGSRGGLGKSVTFRNGATLRVMTGGGRDKTRAHYTSRVVIITETDGMDEPGTTSREADKISQLEVRTRAFGSRARIYMECTVSTKAGRTWREYQAGTQSRIFVPCPLCSDYVHLQRDDLVGWREAADPITAETSARWRCPSCGKTFDDAARRLICARSRLVHRGQRIDRRGRVTGDPPRTHTLGFRWSAPDNLLIGAPEVAVDEWNKLRSVDEENDEKKLRQFVWALPYEPPKVDLSALDPAGVTLRTTKHPRGHCPPGTEVVTTTVDVGKYACHWVTIAWRSGATSSVIDYGVFDVPVQDLAPEVALLMALREFRDNTTEAGWLDPETGDLRKPDQVWIDAGGYFAGPVHEFANESPDRYRACIGFGTSRVPRPYWKPRKKTPQIAFIGEGYHVARIKRGNEPGRVELVEIDANTWKTFLQARMTTNMAKPGAMSLFAVPARNDHLTFAQHLAAERKEEQFKPGKGRLWVWITVSRRNHFLDASYMGCCAAHYAGIRLLRPASGKPRAATKTVSVAEFFGPKKRRRR